MPWMDALQWDESLRRYGVGLHLPQQCGARSAGHLADAGGDTRQTLRLDAAVTEVAARSDLHYEEQANACGLCGRQEITNTLWTETQRNVTSVFTSQRSIYAAK